MNYQYEPFINRKILASKIHEYINTGGYFTEYKKTQEFEELLAKTLDVKYCSVVNNGTISLSLSLLAHGVKAGDYVLVPNITMIATSSAVRLIGAKPIFMDVDSINLCMNIKKAKEAILTCSSKTTALIYVTLNGRSHSIEKLTELNDFCKKNNIAFIQDNAQSLGSYLNNKSPINSIGDGLGSFSFSMAKIITTGQGGCIVTNNEILANKIKKLKDFGRESGGNDIHDDFGINCKFTEIQAIMGLTQLSNIKERITNKKKIYEIYYNELKDIKEIKFLDTDLEYVTPWFVDIYIEDREDLANFLSTNAIGTRAIYPALTSQKVNDDCIKDGLEISNEYSTKGLWLPSSMTLTEYEIKEVCAKIKNYYQHKHILKNNKNECPIIIDSCKGHELYKGLEKYNQDIFESVKEYTFISDRKYDTGKKEASWWFDPRCVRDLSISHVYPNCLPVQHDPRFCLTLYAPNYFALLLINTLYENKDIKIEEQAGGMGKLLFYLNKLGYHNFHMVDNFTQLPKDLLDSLMNRANITYDLNNYEYIPQILNLIGYTHFVKEIREETELVIIYNNVKIIISDIDGNCQYLLGNLDNYISLKNKVCLAIDKYGLAKAYCNKEKAEEFREKLLIYGE